MDIYIKPKQKAIVSGKDRATLKDIMDIIAPDKVKKQLDKTEITIRSSKTKSLYLVSVTDIVNAILKKYPEAKINNLGEMDVIVEFQSGKKENPLFKWLKITFVVIVLLTGASTAIMSFHSDAQMSKIFQNYNKIFIGKYEEKPLIIEIPYSIGLAAGIIVFFNHFGGRRLTKDPTPIEVEMCVYETEVNDTLITGLGKIKEQDKESRKNHG